MWPNYKSDFKMFNKIKSDFKIMHFNRKNVNINHPKPPYTLTLKAKK